MPAVAFKRYGGDPVGDGIADYILFENASSNALISFDAKAWDVYDTGITVGSAFKATQFYDQYLPCDQLSAPGIIIHGNNVGGFQTTDTGTGLNFTSNLSFYSTTLNTYVLCYFSNTGQFIWTPNKDLTGFQTIDAGGGLISYQMTYMPDFLGRGVEGIFIPTYAPMTSTTPTTYRARTFEIRSSGITYTGVKNGQMVSTNTSALNCLASAAIRYQETSGGRVVMSPFVPTSASSAQYANFSITFENGWGSSLNSTGFTGSVSPIFNECRAVIAGRDSLIWVGDSNPTATNVFYTTASATGVFPSYSVDMPVYDIWQGGMYDGSKFLIFGESSIVHAYHLGLGAYEFEYYTLPRTVAGGMSMASRKTWTP